MISIMYIAVSVLIVFNFKGENKAIMAFIPYLIMVGGVGLRFLLTSILPLPYDQLGVESITLMVVTPMALVGIFVTSSALLIDRFIFKK
jgi:multisubunit Na+/H+ antiporter MnhB subunit